ncbi:glycoside hydrolase family 104 protein [Comamonas sp.]|uniref:glycoside hydrolase family 24 protein n=1 Tax=Comamonas sp. TaxID=34028 RepID=UPI003A8DFC49
MSRLAAFVTLATVAAGAVMLMRQGRAADDQTADALDSLGVMLDPTTYTPADVAPDEADMNLKAFLDMIAASEGTAGRGDNGYNILVGGGTFDSYADHPRTVVQVRAGLASSAAGRYQFLARTWDSLAARLSLPDFSPQSQDAAAIELIRERGALNDVKAGRVEVAIQKVAKIWASLPGAGYNQPERRLSYLIAAYQNAGGALA